MEILIGITEHGFGVTCGCGPYNSGFYLMVEHDLITNHAYLSILVAAN